MRGDTVTIEDALPFAVEACPFRLSCDEADAASVETPSVAPLTEIARSGKAAAATLMTETLRGMVLPS